MWEMYHRAQGVPDHHVLPVSGAQHVKALCHVLLFVWRGEGGLRLYTRSRHSK